MENQTTTTTEQTQEVKLLNVWKNEISAERKALETKGYTREEAEKLIAKEERKEIAPAKKALKNASIASQIYETIAAFREHSAAEHCAYLVLSFLDGSKPLTIGLKAGFSREVVAKQVQTLIDAKQKLKEIAKGAKGFRANKVITSASFRADFVFHGKHMDAGTIGEVVERIGGIALKDMTATLNTIFNAIEICQLEETGVLVDVNKLIAAQN